MTLEYLAPLTSIPVHVDERFPNVYYVPPMQPISQHEAIRYPEQFRTGYLVGSLNAWGEFYARNVAAAYRPEGVS